MQTYTAHEREAYELGKAAAIAAASWTVDGNSSEQYIRRVLAMFDDGDPQLDDYLPPMPDLSGEWANGPTPTSLWGEIVGFNADGGIDADGDELAALCDAYEAGVADHFMAECERVLRAAL